MEPKETSTIPLKHSTLSGLIALSKDTPTKSMGNYPSIKKIGDAPIGTNVGSIKVFEKPQMTQELGTVTNHEKLEAEKGKETMLEHFHTPGNLGNILTWGD
jgi:hypothetical protein